MGTLIYSDKELVKFNWGGNGYDSKLVLSINIFNQYIKFGDGLSDDNNCWMLMNTFFSERRSWSLIYLML